MLDSKVTVFHLSRCRFVFCWYICAALRTRNPAIIASLLLVVVGQVELLEQRTADGQRHILEVAERVG
jgi:hypothetical protein